MALYINGQLQTMSSKIRYNESTDMVQIYYQGQWHDWQAGGANIPDGSTVTPINDVTIWQQCAGIANPTYTTLSDVLADSSILSILINSNNAVDYMVRSTNWATNVCNNSNAMTNIGNDNYCANILLADSTWRTAICNSTYFERVLNAKVPNMTSNTAPSGVVSASSYYSGGGLAPWKAFNSSTVVGWGTSGDNSPYIQYDFERSVSIKKVWTKGIDAGSPITYTGTLKGSNDRVTYTTIGNISVVFNSTSNLVVNNNSSYRYYRLAFSNDVSAGSGMKLQFYGREDV